jgi:hypothetical protein
MLLDHVAKNPKPSDLSSTAEKTGAGMGRGSRRSRVSTLGVPGIVRQTNSFFIAPSPSDHGTSRAVPVRQSVRMPPPLTPCRYPSFPPSSRSHGGAGSPGLEFLGVRDETKSQDPIITVIINIMHKRYSCWIISIYYLKFHLILKDVKLLLMIYINNIDFIQ